MNRILMFAGAVPAFFPNACLCRLRADRQDVLYRIMCDSIASLSRRFSVVGLFYQGLAEGVGAVNSIE